MRKELVHWTTGGMARAGLLAVVVLGVVAARAEVLEGEMPFQGHPADGDENWQMTMGEAIA